MFPVLNDMPIQHYPSKYLCMIALWMALYTTATASVEPLKLKKAKYWPTTLYTLGVTGRVQIPVKAIDEHNYIKLETIYPTPSLSIKIPLVEFRKSFLHAGLDIGHSYTETSIPTDHINLTEHHLQACPSIGFTFLANSYFYVLNSVWMGCEIDAIVGSELTENGAVDKQWSSVSFIESMVIGLESKYFYGIYFGYSVNIPLGSSIKTASFPKKSQFTKSGSWKRKFASDARILTSSLVTIFLGFDVLSILYPPSTEKKGKHTAHPKETAAVYGEEI